MGKNILLPATTTLLILLLSLSPTRTTADVVRDSEGNPVEAGSEYYIRPVGIGFRGGITRSPKSQQSRCPLYAVESPNEVDPGQAVKFLPILRSKHILLSSKLRIDSGFSAYCRQDGLWRMSLDAWSRRFVVSATGPFGVPGDWFKIEKSESSETPSYKITSCPPNTSSLEGEVLCKDLGISNGISGLKLLGVTNNNPESTLHVAFFKKPADKIVAYSATN